MNRSFETFELREGSISTRSRSTVLQAKVLVDDTAFVLPDSGLQRLLERGLIVLVEVIQWSVNVWGRRGLLSSGHFEAIERTGEGVSLVCGYSRLD